MNSSLEKIVFDGIFMDSDGELFHRSDCKVCALNRAIKFFERSAMKTEDLSHADFLYMLANSAKMSLKSLTVEEHEKCSKDLEIVGELLSQGI